MLGVRSRPQVAGRSQDVDRPETIVTSPMMNGQGKRDDELRPTECAKPATCAASDETARLEAPHVVAQRAKIVDRVREPDRRPIDRGRWPDVIISVKPRNPEARGAQQTPRANTQG